MDPQRAKVRDVPYFARRREVMAMASLDTAEDMVPEVANTESRHTLKKCGKLFDSKKKLRAQ